MIHPSCIISKQAEIDEGVTLDPYVVVRGSVQIGKGTHIHSHAIIGSEFTRVKIGQDNTIFSGAVVGEIPQDKKYNNELSELIIGDGNSIRECVTLNVGTAQGGNKTFLGNHNLIMAYVHFGHDCIVGNGNVIANSCQFAGHVTVEDNAIVGGMCAINQFTRIGSFSFVGGGSIVNKDVAPFCIAQGNYAVMRATNKIGLERHGFSSEDIQKIHKSLRTLIKGHGTIEERTQGILDLGYNTPHVGQLVDFIKASERGLAL